MLPQVENLDPEQEALVDWAVLQLQGSEGKCQRTRLGVKDFSTQVNPVSVDRSAIQTLQIRLLRAPSTSSPCSLSTQGARSAPSGRRLRSARWSSGRRSGSTSRKFSGTRQLAAGIRKTVLSSL